MTSTLEILKAARDLIAEPEHWTQGDFAKTKDGRSISEHSREAFCFCMYGAISRVSRPHSDAATDVVRKFVPQEMVADFNDSHTHPEVLAVFDKAIASLEVSA